MRASRLLLALCAILLVAIGLGARFLGTGPVDVTPGSPSELLPKDIASLPEEAPIPGERVVVVQKANRVLGMYVDGRLSLACRIGLGGAPEGHKQREGDGRTPEGEYYVCTRNPRSRFHLFLGISYPNTGDAQRAYEEGRISARQLRSIQEASDERRQPPWDTPLGGEIGLHGSGAHSDWTLGCIAMENDNIEALWDALRVGDPVVIRR